MIDQRNSTEARFNRLPFFVAVLRLIVGGLSIAAAPFIVFHPIFGISAAVAATTAAMGIVAGVIITGLTVRSIYRQWRANKAIRQEQQAAAESATEPSLEPRRRRSRRRRRRQSIRQELGLEPENTSLPRQQSESRLSSSPEDGGVRIIPRPSVSHSGQPSSRVTSVQPEASPAVSAEMEVIYDEGSPLAGAPADGKGTKPEEKKSSFFHRVAEALEFNAAKDVNSVVGFFYGQPASSPSQSPTEKNPPGVTADNPEGKPLRLDSNNPFVDNEEKTKQEEENLNLNNSIETLKYNLKFSAGNVESLFAVLKHIFEFGGRFDQHVKQHLDTQLKNKNFVEGMLECVKKQEIQSSPSVRSEMNKFKELLQEELSLLRDKLYQDKANALQRALNVFAKYEINETQKNNEALIRHSSNKKGEDKSHEQLFGEAKKKVSDHFFSQSRSGGLTVQARQSADDKEAKKPRKGAWLGHMKDFVKNSLVKPEDLDDEIRTLLKKHEVSDEELESLFGDTSDTSFLEQMYQVLQNKGDESFTPPLASMKVYLRARLADAYSTLISGEVSNYQKDPEASVKKITDIVIAALQVKTPVEAILKRFESRWANQTFVQDMMEHLNVEGLSGQVKTDVQSLQRCLRERWNELEKNKKEFLELREEKRKADKQGKGAIQDLLKKLAQIEIEKGEVYQFSADREAPKITKKMSEMKPGQKTREELICDHLALAGTPASDKTRVLTDDHIVILLKKEHWEDKDLASKVKARMIEKWLEEFKQLKLETEVASTRARVIVRSLCDLDVNGWTTHKVDVVKGYMEQLRPNDAHIDFLLQEKFWDGSALRPKVAQSLGFEQGESSRSSLTQTSAPKESHASSFGSLGVATRFGFGGFFSSAKSVAKSFIAEVKDITGQTESELLESIMGCKTVDKETKRLVGEFLRSTGSLARTLEVLVEPILSGRLTRDKADCILEQVESKWVGPDMEPACKEIRASVDVLFALQNKGGEKVEVSKRVVAIIRQKDVLDNDQIIPLLKAGYNKKKIDEDALAFICNGIWDKQDAVPIMQSIKSILPSFGYARG